MADTIIWIQCVFIWFYIPISDAVDCGTPTYQLTMDQACTDYNNIVSPPNTLEGATVEYSCKSYLWRTKAGDDYCPIERCESNGKWRKAELSCGSSECYHTTSMDYEGLRNCSITGKMCQRWDAQPLQSRPYINGSSFPDSTLAKAKNYCRDPDGVNGTLWCYTEPDSIAESCGIPNCSDVTIGQGLCSGDYCGDIAGSMVTDNTCAMVVIPAANYDRHLHAVVKFACQSLLEEFTSTISHCPVQRCGDDFFWTSPSISCGTNECYTASNSRNYVGKRSCTKDGWECQRWDSQSPHMHSYTSPSDFPDSQVSGAENFCRDPGGFVGEPWCFTTNAGIVNQTCDIPQCLNMTVNYGHCAPPATTPASTTSTPLTSTASPPGRSTRYMKTSLSRTGYEAQYNVPEVRSSISCARMCTQQSYCVFITVDGNKSCTLYRENPTITDTVECTSIKCYILDHLF